MDRKHDDIVQRHPSLIDLIREDTTINDSKTFNSNKNDSVKTTVVDHDDLIHEAENAYINTVDKIVDISRKHLSELQDHRINLRNKFVRLFTLLVVSQTAILLTLFLIIGSPMPFNLSENILLCYMGTLMIETLGCVVIMIKFSFSTSEEAHIISVLNSIVGQYQKYEEEKKKDKI